MSNEEILIQENAKLRLEIKSKDLQLLEAINLVEHLRKALQQATALLELKTPK